MKDLQRPALIFDGLGHPARLAIFLHLLTYGQATNIELREVVGMGVGIRDHISKMISASLIERSGRKAQAMIYRLNPKTCVESGGVRTIRLPDTKAGLIISAHA